MCSRIHIKLHLGHPRTKTPVALNTSPSMQPCRKEYHVWMQVKSIDRRQYLILAVCQGSELQWETGM